MATSAVQTRRWVLAERPQGLPTRNTFRFETVNTPALGEECIQVRISHFSVDPGTRPSLSQESYAGALPLGAPVTSAALGVVEASRSQRFREGDLVYGAFGWQDRVSVPARGVQKLDRELFAEPLTPTAAIGVLGVPGLTAYFALQELSDVQPGQTVLISSASGPVGATAGQIARLKGARVVGLAGSAEKLDWILREARFDAAINYRTTSDLSSAIAETCPGGVDLYLDNVGGEMLDAAIVNMKAKGLILVSGQIAEYNRPQPQGIRNTLRFITHRLRMEGFVVLDYARQFAAAQQTLAGWIRSGEIVYREEITAGIEHAPEAFIEMFAGRNFGRRIIAV